MIRLTILITLLLTACTGLMARKTPEELAATTDQDLCQQYFLVTGNAHAATTDMGTKELRIIFDEFKRRGVSPDQVAYHCTQP